MTIFRSHVYTDKVYRNVLVVQLMSIRLELGYAMCCILSGELIMRRAIGIFLGISSARFFFSFNLIKLVYLNSLFFHCEMFISFQGGNENRIPDKCSTN